MKVWIACLSVLLAMPALAQQPPVKEEKTTVKPAEKTAEKPAVKQEAEKPAPVATQTVPLVDGSSLQVIEGKVWLVKSATEKKEVTSGNYTRDDGHVMTINAGKIELFKKKDD